MRMLLTIGTIGLTLWAAGFVFYVRSIPPAGQPPKHKADVIVVLTGGAERIATGFHLLAEGVAENLFISGVGHDTNVSNMIQLYAVKQDTPKLQALAAHVTLDPVARNTKQNARETKRYLRQNNHKNVLLVTANYHMPRSLIEMRHAIPDILFIPYAVDPHGFNLERWWVDIKTHYLMLAEYHKIMLVKLRHILGH